MPHDSRLKNWVTSLSEPYQSEFGCPLCDTHDYLQVAKKGRFHLPVGLALCPECSHLYARPRVRPEHQKALFERWFWSLYFPQLSFHQRQLNERAQGARALSFVQRHSLLEVGEQWHDFGCGTGGVVAFLKESGYRATGSERDKDARQFGCQAGLSLTPEPRVSDLKILSLIRVLHYLDDPLVFLSQARDWLAPGGLVYVELPGVRTWLRGAGCRASCERLLSPFHYQYFDLRNLTRLFQANGFRLVAGTEQIQALFTLEPSYENKQPNSQMAFFLLQNERYRPIWWLLSFVPSKVRKLVDGSWRNSFRVYRATDIA